MSLDSIRLSLTETCDGEDNSVLNGNVNFSQLEMSLISNETTSRDDSTGPTSCKLSITLDQEERNLIKNQRGRNIRSGSLLKISPTKTPKKHAFPSSNSIDIKDMSKEEETKNDSTNLTIQGDEDDEENESVIPIEDDEEESVIPVEDDTEISDNTLQNTKQKSQDDNLTDEMFLHLQPNKSDIVETETTMEVDVIEPNEMIPEASYVDEEISQLLPDESGFFKHPFVELGRRLWVSTDQQQCYTKGCLWSPDGTCLLVPVHMDGMHVIELPIDMYTTQELNTGRELSPLNSAVHVKEGGMVYDCAWYPFMNSTDPATCCWLASRQHEPIHMWDAFNGDLRCSYRGYDDVDEVESAISTAFSNDGQKVVGGYKKNIKIFDTNIPGRDYTSIPVKQTVSCFAFTTENDNCVTTGSWNSHIYHYDLRAPKLGPLFILGEHTGGITWLKYSAFNTDNWYLFSGARKDNRILQWDMRNYQKPVQIFERKVDTNQRIYFDMSPLQKWLISGDTGGLLRIWDIEGMQENIQIPLHSDCCNGVSCHPTLPIISTCSGQYHFIDNYTDTERTEPAPQKTVSYENSVLFLWFGPSKIANI